jgi:hypothetical protein
VALPINIGIADASRRTSDLPLYTLQNKATGERVKTTDPGRALVTGRWADIGKFKGPILRGLAARAPYFHNGSAASLADVVKFYDERFDIGHLCAGDCAGERELLGDLDQPLFELRRGPRVERRHRADDTGLALGDDELGRADDEERRADDGQRQVRKDRGQFRHVVLSPGSFL